ncbi:hypothetical protein QBC46DRAFT_272414 [Diplogelasinospora grovesii]|uniref:Uncharacterized protein n=1 Tax=Diplogelasinospora grovesii TaxID=303347 RepID=A0AAN6RZR3_9PEZI|nr:hypothetical protein QBC46DRAFT_272414 [Diplogelasinospora grovesii]
MIFHDVLLVFFLLLCHSVRALNTVLSMTLWTGQNKAKWTEKPTWHQETLGAFLPGDKNYEQVLDIAHAYYNWLKDQPNAVTPNGVCMVAVMWDPVSKIVYASSIPQGPRKAQNGAAPLWYGQVRQFVSAYPAPPSANPFHAEDGVFFNFETSKGTNTANGRYPDGCIIAVWGKYPSDATDREISLCSTPDSRNPTCQGVAQALGVQFKTIQETPQQAQEDSSDDEFGPPLTADDFDEIMAACPAAGPSNRFAIRGRGLIRKDAGTSCIPFPFPSDISASTLSTTLDPTDSDTTTKAPEPTTTFGLIYGG